MSTQKENIAKNIKFCNIIANSIAKTMRLSLDEIFRKKCHDLLQASCTNECETRMRDKLVEMVEKQINRSAIQNGPVISESGSEYESGVTCNVINKVAEEGENVNLQNRNIDEKLSSVSQPTFNFDQKMVKISSRSLDEGRTIQDLYKKYNTVSEVEEFDELLNDSSLQWSPDPTPNFDKNKIRKEVITSPRATLDVDCVIPTKSQCVEKHPSAGHPYEGKTNDSVITKNSLKNNNFTITGPEILEENTINDEIRHNSALERAESDYNEDSFWPNDTLSWSPSKEGDSQKINTSQSSLKGEGGWSQESSWTRWSP